MTVPVQVKYSDVGGTFGQGEFGTMLLMIFEPESETAFQWERWQTRGDRRLSVYSYHVMLTRSRYTLRLKGMPDDLVVGFHGEVEIDTASDQVMRYTYLPDSMPPGSNISSVKSTMEYAMAEINGQEYLLPSRMDTIVVGVSGQARNETQFREYRKFSSESSIKFSIPK